MWLCDKRIPVSLISMHTKNFVKRERVISYNYCNLIRLLLFDWGLLPYPRISFRHSMWVNVSFAVFFPQLKYIHFTTAAIAQSSIINVHSTVFTPSTIMRINVSIASTSTPRLNSNWRQNDNIYKANMQYFVSPLFPNGTIWDNSYKKTSPGPLYKTCQWFTI